MPQYVMCQNVDKLHTLQIRFNYFEKVCPHLRKAGTYLIIKSYGAETIITHANERQQQQQLIQPDWKDLYAIEML